LRGEAPWILKETEEKKGKGNRREGIDVSSKERPPVLAGFDFAKKSS